MTKIQLKYFSKRTKPYPFYFIHLTKWKKRGEKIYNFIKL